MTLLYSRMHETRRRGVCNPRQEAVKFFVSQWNCVCKEDAFVAWLSLKSHNDSWETVHFR